MSRSGLTINPKNSLEVAKGNYTIIFSINPQDNNGSKKSYNGLGYPFNFPILTIPNIKLHSIVLVLYSFLFISAISDLRYVFFQKFTNLNFCSKFNNSFSI